MTTTSLAGRAAPGGLLPMVAERLAGVGLDVSAPAEEEDGCRLDIAMPGARCTLAVGDCGSAEWEYWPWSADDADPDLTADLAGHQRENVTFKGIVGLELKARGLEAELVVYCDETAFDTFAEIIATVPGQGDGGGQVCVTDEGGLTWTRDYWAEAAAMVSAPDRCGQVTDPASVASVVVEAVTRAISFLRPAEARQAGHG